MRWRSARPSSHIEDRRGAGPGRVGGLGLGGVAIVVVISLLMGKNPLELLGLLSQMDGGPVATAPGPGVDDEQKQFIASILGETEDVWQQVFAARGGQYPAPTLVLFDGRVQSACGIASAAVGPFYCPNDQQVYLDTSFFADMRRLGASNGDFARAYVIAHEVGHHVQNLTGSLDRLHAARQRGEDVEGANGLSVRSELQADCYAGVWASLAEQRHAWLEPGDIDEALQTASAIGDDRLQRRSQGTVVPDAFTHGSADQRVRWFRTGFDSGDPAHCDTFAATRL